MLTPLAVVRKDAQYFFPKLGLMNSSRPRLPSPPWFPWSFILTGRGLIKGAEAGCWSWLSWQLFQLLELSCWGQQWHMAWVSQTARGRSHLSFTEKHSTQSQQKHGLARVHLMETLLGNPTVFNVKNAVEGLHVEQIHLLQVFQGEWDTAQLLPHQRGQVEVQRLLCANGNPH